MAAAEASGGHVADCGVSRALAQPRSLSARWWAELAPGAPADNLIHALALHLQAVEAANRSVETLKIYEGRYRQSLAYLESQGHTRPFELPLLSADNVRGASTWVREQSTRQRGRRVFW